MRIMPLFGLHERQYFDEDFEHYLHSKARFIGCTQVTHYYQEGDDVFLVERPKVVVEPGVWICAKDQMPEDNDEEVYLWLKADSDEKFPADVNESQWENGVLTVYGVHVTHWMRIPRTPRR